MTAERFAYSPLCTFPGCDAPAACKVAAVWSDGRFRELKTYGLACASHADEILALARDKQSSLRLAEGESIEPPELHRLGPGRLDLERERVG